MASNTTKSLPRTRDVVNAAFGDVKDYSKLVGQMPVDDYDYHLAFPGFRREVEQQSETLIDVLDKCCQLLPKRRRVALSGVGASSETAPQALSASPAARLNDAQRTAVMEAVDSMLESVDTILDDLRGRKMHSEDQLSVTFGSALSEMVGASASTAAADSASGGVIRVAHVLRPQLTFARAVDNSDEPFLPIYHDAAGHEHTGVAGVHPFAETIAAFAVPPAQLLPKADTPFAPLESCPLVFVDTAAELRRVAAELAAASEIAVDLEHHDFFSFQGFTCLMQISTRTADYIIDCLRLRACMHLLAPVFLDPAVLKVFHGAREDVRWLQKDFALYVVNFFDTGIALQTLHMPYSLAFAVDHFCQVKLNKKYQTADWRMRPLPAEMVNYARQDTHYLLYVYDRLKALLLNSEAHTAVGNLLVHVYNESRRLSLDVYEKPRLMPEESYKAALGRSLGGLRPVQERVARDIFNWRDAAAREADDSPTAVMHLSSVLAIASKLPTSARDLLRCCSPASAVLRRSVAHLVELVRSALEAHVDVSSSLGERGLSAEVRDGAGLVGNTEGAHGAFAYRRTAGTHRPMTGTLPSISSTASPAPFSLGVASVPLTDTGRSTWFRAMEMLSTAMAARPRPHVPLPGSDILAAMQAKRAAQKSGHAHSAETGEGHAPESATSTRKRSRSPTPPVDAPSGAHGTSDALTEEPANLLSDDGEKTVATPAVLEGAVSLRQAYGTGAQDRKKSKAKVSASLKKKKSTDGA